MSNKMVTKINEIEYHRNGVGGEGFNVVKFTDDQRRNMLAVVFPLNAGENRNGRVAVFDLDLLAKGNITFGINSWRGDCFESELRDAIAKTN